MRESYNTMAALAALLLAVVCGGGGTICVCIGAEGHVEIKPAPKACNYRREGHVPHDARRDAGRSEAMARLGGASHDCDCVDISICVGRLSAVPMKLKARHAQPTAAPTPAQPLPVRTVDVRTRTSAPHAQAAILRLRSVVLLV